MPQATQATDPFDSVPVKHLVRNAKDFYSDMSNLGIQPPTMLQNTLQRLPGSLMIG